MKNNFWQNLTKPIIILAPMADVTDSAFRQIIAKKSEPELEPVFYTEFVSADGLCHPVAHEKLKRELYFTENERPIVAQIFTSHPDKAFKVAQLIASLGFDGIDINMGCPDRNVEKQGAGASLIKTPTLACELIEALKAGAPTLPVSVKTRVGYNRIDELEKWAENLISAKPDTITFHLRTRKEMSKVPAHWDLLKIPVAMARGTGILIFGNGDLVSVADAKEKVLEAGADGAMLGRAVFGNPWLFSNKNILPRERVETLAEHIKFFIDLYNSGQTNDDLFGGHTKNFQIMKKHFKSYLALVPDSGQLKDALIGATSGAEALEKIKAYLAQMSA